MFSLEELQKDLADYELEQKKLENAHARLSGAMQLLSLQIEKLKECEESAEQEDAA
jgi:hypothetical protein